MGQSTPLRRTAVVVEDDEIQRDMIALLLEESGFNVIQCEDAETASLAVKTRRPSLLVTDVNLTGKMNGAELAQFARTANPALRVVVISGQPLTDRLPDGVTFFQKPVYPVALLREATN
jgi:two-component system, cell cycle response regulator CpdR